MTATFNGSLNLNLVTNLNNALDLGNVGFNYSKNYTNAITNGAAANQCNMVFTDTRTLAASAHEDLDLSGVLVNSLGVTIAFTSIKGIIFVAAAANANNVIIGGAASDQFFACFGANTDTVIVKPGGFFALYDPTAAGYAVTATTADLLHVANSSSGTGVTYDVILIGTV